MKSIPSLSLCLAALAVSQPSVALTARAVPLDELARSSAHVLVGTAREHRSAWVTLSSGRRIVTYTRVVVEQSITGSAPSELWVRTLGGVVEGVGQFVPGEAPLVPGVRALLFLARAEDGFVVNELSQGMFTIIAGPTGASRVRATSEGVTILSGGGRPSAREQLDGAELADAVRRVRAAGVAHAR